MYSSINVTDTMVIWSTDNAAVATIENGVVTAVGKGTTLVHAEYGGVKYSCKIRVKGGAAAPETTPTTTPPATPGTFTMTFNTKYVNDAGVGDVIVRVGGTWKMYSSISIPADQVTWTTENPAIATVQNGVVTAVSTGDVMIFAEYGGVKYACIVRVQN